MRKCIIYVKHLLILWCCLSCMNHAKACSCAPFQSYISVRDYIAMPYIFSGTVKEVTINQQEITDKQKKILFRVDEVFKGNINDSIITFYTSISDASCGVYFEVNESWVIWAYVNDGVLMTNLCTRSNRRKNITDKELSMLRYLHKSPTDSVWFDTDGRKAAEGKLYQQQPVGYWKYYYRNGYIEYEGNYLNHKAEGTWIKYLDPEGIVTRLKYDKKIPQDSMPDLTRLMYKIFTIENYQNGLRNGEFIFFQYASYHKPKEISNYSKGRPHGKTIRYYDNGQIYYEQNFRDGELHGYERFYYESGQLRRSGKFDNGKPVGQFTLYDEDGKLIRTALNKRVE
jgi:antitoxin component YwqK of YwqJK toxin-antitoxin module